MVAISSASHSASHDWRSYALAAAEAATANDDFMAALKVKSPTAAAALEAFVKANDPHGNHGAGGGNGTGSAPPVATPPVVIPPVVVALPVIVPEVVAAVAQPVSAVVAGRKPAVPPGRIVSAAVSSAAAGHVPAPPPGKALGLLKRQPPVDASAPANVSPEPAPTAPVASPFETAAAPRNTSERVSLLYRATEARDKAPVPMTVAEIGREMLAAIDQTAISPQQNLQTQLGVMAQQLLDTQPARSDDSEERPRRTDVTA